MFKPSPSSPPPAPSSDDVPYPPRFRWLKRLTAGYVTLLVLLAAAYAGWTAYSRQRLAAEIAAIRARGEPILLADFLPADSLSDERNGGVPLKAAADLLEADQKNNTFPPPFPTRYWHDPWLTESATEKERQQAALYFADRAEILRLVRSARTFDAADWGTRIRSNWIQARLAHLSTQHELASLLTRAAAYRHAIGDDAEAAEIALDLLHQSDLIALDAPTAPAISTSQRVALEAVRVLDHLAPTLSLPRPHVRRLIDALLDDRLARARFAAWPPFERAGTLDTFQSYFEGKRMWAAPMLRLDTVRSIRRWELLCAAAPTFSYAELRPATRPFRNEWDDLPRRGEGLWQNFRRPYPPRLERVTHLLSQIAWPTAHSMAQGEASTRLARRIVAVRLAARSYQLDHGRLPRAWDELVPAYLDAVPRDPFAPGDEPLRMIGADGLVIVYSVGPNGVDDGGADHRRASLRYAGDDWQKRDALPRTAWDQWGGIYFDRRPDLAYPLQIDRPPPPTPTAGSAP